MEMILADWRSGNVTLVTSALTIAEVLWVKCEEDEARSMIDRSREPEIIALFDPPPSQRLTVVELSRITAMAARELFWDHGIKPKDAIHVASALATHCPVIHTNDVRLQEFSGRVGGTPELRIRAPSWVRQTEMELEADEPPA